MSVIEIDTDGGRRWHWMAADKPRIVEETLDEGASISVVARRNGVAPNLLAGVAEAKLTRFDCISLPR